MRRFLLSLLLFTTVIFILRRFAGLMARGGRRRAAGGLRHTELVRDKVCNTFLPRDRALEVKRLSGEIRYFCSEGCRARFLSGDERGCDAA